MRTGQPKKAGILLTHHQPVSSYEESSGKLLERLRPTLKENLVRAWFWGHEHRCAIYKKRARIEYPRLIGHGGVPVWAPKVPQPADVVFQYGMEPEREYFERYGSERFQRFGFAELTFEEQHIEVRYLTELGAQAKDETLRVTS